MTRPRKEQVSVDQTPYYHVGSRCVRRAYLCGFDDESQTSYEHRKQWVVDRIRLLSSIYAIDICAYAVMSNHYHLVVKLCPEQEKTWSDDEVLWRWTTVCKGPVIVQRARKGEKLKPQQQQTLKDLILVYRKRLTDLSWFMKQLNEHIARSANKEDNCTGHFWESRFNSQGLPDDEALLACMTYVDLNPVRAGIAETPEVSDYTSIQERISPKFDARRAIEEQASAHQVFGFDLPVKPLVPFLDQADSQETAIPFSFNDYLQLVDWTGRAVREDKHGHINNTLPSILTRLLLNNEDWLNRATGFERWYRAKRPRVMLA